MWPDRWATRPSRVRLKRSHAGKLRVPADRHHIRMQNHLTPRTITAPLRFAGAEVRPSERELLVDGQPVAVGARAFDLLLALIERRERIVSKSELLDLVWPGLVVEENNLQVHVSALRKLLGPAVIATVPGRGYRFTALLGGA